MYENGIVMLDLADLAVGCLGDSDEAPAGSRCESLLLILPAVKCEAPMEDLSQCFQDPWWWELPQMIASDCPCHCATAFDNGRRLGYI